MPCLCRSGGSRSVVRAGSPPNEQLVCPTPSSRGGQARSRRRAGSDHRGFALLRGRSGRARTRGSGVRAGNVATNTDPTGQFRDGIADRPGPRKDCYHDADGRERRLGRCFRTRADNRWMRGGALGSLLQPLGTQWIPPPTAFLLVGMAGFFAAAAKTPFSTLVIMCELTGDFGLIGPALGVCVGCFLLSGRDSLFDSQPAHRTDAPVQDSSGCPSK